MLKPVGEKAIRLSNPNNNLLTKEYLASLPIDLIKHYSNEDWDWIFLSRNKHLTLLIVSDMADKPWDWTYLTTRFSLIEILKWQELPWDFQELAKKKAVSSIKIKVFCDEGKSKVSLDFLNKLYQHQLPENELVEQPKKRIKWDGKRPQTFKKWDAESYFRLEDLVKGINLQARTYKGILFVSHADFDSLCKSNYRWDDIFYTRKLLKAIFPKIDEDIYDEENGMFGMRLL